VTDADQKILTVNL